MTAFISLCAAILLSLVLFAPSSSTAQTPDSTDRGYMIAVIDQYTSEAKLLRIDPHAETSIPLLPPQMIARFLVNRSGQVIYTANTSSQAQYYVIDAHNPSQAPVAFDDSIGMLNYSVIWSDDGRPRTFVTHASIDSDDRLFVLGADGNPVEITPQDRKYSGRANYVDGMWSNKGQFAFIYYTSSLTKPIAFPSELYLWDGTQTVNLSREPYALYDISAITWSPDGQLAFRSRTYSPKVVVWNGTLNADGLPDPGSFVTIAPELTGGYSELQWMDRGRLAFVGVQPELDGTQLYAWDGTQVTNLITRPGYTLRFTKWTPDGRWAFLAARKGEREYLYVRDASDSLLMMSRALGVPSWSEDGILAFCRPQSGRWTLVLWDGTTLWEAAHGDSIDAKWENGGGVSCSNG